MNTTSTQVVRPNGIKVFSGEVELEGVHLPGVKEPQMSANATVNVDSDFSRTQATAPVSTPEDKQAARESTESDPEQARLKSRAQRLRARLAQTLESLTQRKENAVDLTRQIKDHPLPFAVAGASTVAVLIAGVTYLAARRPLPPTLGDRLRALGEALQHPERVHVSPPRAKLAPGEMTFGRKAALTVLSLVAAEAAKFGLAQLKAQYEASKQS